MSSKKPIALSSLNAKLRSYIEHGVTYGSIWFDCPLCQSDYCWHVVPYSPTGDKTPAGSLIWTHVSGDSIENLTLSPSYRKLTGCKIHGFVRNGTWVSC